jgi:hypothetical protein
VQSSDMVRDDRIKSLLGNRLGEWNGGDGTTSADAAQRRKFGRPRLPQQACAHPRRDQAMKPIAQTDWTAGSARTAVPLAAGAAAIRAFVRQPQGRLFAARLSARPAFPDAAPQTVNNIPAAKRGT